MRKNVLMRNILLVITLLSMVFVFAGCKNNNSNTTTNQYNSDSTSGQTDSTPQPTANNSADQTDTGKDVKHAKVQIEIKDAGKMVFELYPEYAPETVANFVKLAKSGFYEGIKFHRIIKGFMIQGGDPKGDGTGGSSENIKGEFAANGFNQNTLSHKRGVISMARSNDPNSASSQFFIMHNDNPGLDGNYAAFGKLIEGDDVLESVANTPCKLNEMSGEVSIPEKDVVISKVTVIEE